MGIFRRLSTSLCNTKAYFNLMHLIKTCIFNVKKYLSPSLYYGQTFSKPLKNHLWKWHDLCLCNQKLLIYMCLLDWPFMFVGWLNFFCCLLVGWFFFFLYFCLFWVLLACSCFVFCSCFCFVLFCSARFHFILYVRFEFCFSLLYRFGSVLTRVVFSNKMNTNSFRYRFKLLRIIDIYLKLFNMTWIWMI